MSDHKYKVRYDIEMKVGEFTKDELMAENKSGTDALLYFSLLYPEDGSFSLLFNSIDGRTGKELDSNELFKVWSMLGHSLSNSKTLSEGKRELCKSVHEIISAPMRKAREDSETKGGG